MKKVLAILSALILFTACRKETPIQPPVDTSKNPQFISVTVGTKVTPIVRVK